VGGDRRFAVLGLGGFGSAAAYRLAKRAHGDVVGFEQFELGHGRGASEDHSRIIRRSYHTPGYVRLADAAYRAWGEVESDAGERLIERTGGIDLWPAGAAIPMADYTASLEACGVPFDLLDATEIRRRWPQWRLPDDVRGMYQADGGIVAASRANAAHRRLAREHGAELRSNTPVTAIRSLRGEVVLEAGGDTYRCETLVVTADAWTNQVLSLLGAGQLPLTVTREQVTYFDAPRPEDFAPGRFPIWIWMDDPSFYGFPAFGEAGPKVGQDVGGPEIDVAERGSDDPPDPVAFDRVERFLERYLPGALGPVIRTKTCLYTLTPDRDFVLDAVPGHPNVLVALGAAHGFKFAALIGDTLADLALDGTTGHDVTPFAIDRPALVDEASRRTFLV
jgi:sarcosine oxidase